jgi:hypothetical protein
MSTFIVCYGPASNGKLLRSSPVCITIFESCIREFPPSRRSTAVSKKVFTNDAAADGKHRDADGSSVMRGQLSASFDSSDDSTRFNRNSGLKLGGDENHAVGSSQSVDGIYVRRQIKGLSMNEAPARLTFLHGHGSNDECFDEQLVHVGFEDDGTQIVSPRSQNTQSLSPRSGKDSSPRSRSSSATNFLQGSAGMAAGGVMGGRSRSNTQTSSYSNSAFARIRIDSFDEFDWQTVLDDELYGPHDEKLRKADEACWRSQATSGNKAINSPRFISKSNPSSPSGSPSLRKTHVSLLADSLAKSRSSHDNLNHLDDKHTYVKKELTDTGTPRNLQRSVVITPRSMNLSDHKSLGAHSAGVSPRTSSAAANPLHKHIGALQALSPSQVRLLANSQPLGPQSGTASGSMADLPITPSKSRVASFESTSPHKSGKDSSSISSKSKGSGFFKF